MTSAWCKSGWTDERRAKQRDAIQSWKPWENSTGPKTAEGKAQAARNGVVAYFNRIPPDLFLRAVKRM